VRLEPPEPPEQHDRVPRCVKDFEDFCVVTGSIQSGLAVQVAATPTSV
jgi:hypothetical protein